MSSLNRSEHSSNNTNFSTAETTGKNLTTAYGNGVVLSNHTTVSSAVITNKVLTVGEVSRSPVVSGVPTVSNMVVKTESQESESSCTDDSTSGLDWKPNEKKLRINDGAVDYSMTSPSYSSTDSSNANSSAMNSGSRSGGLRRSGRDDKLSPEDEERRKVRRERNKLAAAKCRQKRVDQTNQLLAETKTLEDEQSRLQEEIKSFQQQKEELEFLLEAHRVHCGAASQPTTTTVQNRKILPLKSDELRSIEIEMASSQLSSPSGLRRPNMIPIATPLASSAANELTNVPTSGFFMLGLQSMVNGHTGLTPITGLPSSEMVSTSEGGRGMSSSFELSSDAKLTML